MKNEDIKKAFECLTPSEEAKDRMFEVILEKSSEESLKTPWFIRFRPVISTAGAIAACAALFTFAALNPQITGGKNNFVETKPAMESPAVTVISDENMTTTDLTSVTAESSETSVKTTASQTMTTSTEVKTSAKAAEITTAAYTKTTAVQTAAETTPPATTASTVCESEVSVSETETVTSDATSVADLYGDLYDFSLVSWAGRDYTTSYEEVPYSSLVSNLGSGAAFSDTSEGAYTILIYEIEGVPVEKGFAVHYMGQNSYYYFYSAR